MCKIMSVSAGLWKLVMDGGMCNGGTDERKDTVSTGGPGPDTYIMFVLC